MNPYTQTLSEQELHYTSEDGKRKIYFRDHDSRFNRPIVVKQIDCRTEKELEQARREAEFVRNNPHPHICQCLDLSTERTADGYRLFIAFPRMKRNLKEEMDRRVEEGANFPEEELERYLRDLVAVGVFLQQRGIAHRDIKLENIVLDEQGDVFLCDFGFARRLDKGGGLLTTILGTWPQLSPKLRKALIKGNGDSQGVQHDVFKSDVYALGVTFLQLTTFDLPNTVTVLKGLQTLYKDMLEKLEGYSQSWKSVLRKMLTVKESMRPDFPGLEAVLNRSRQYADDEDTEELIVEESADPLQVTIRYGYSSLPARSLETVPMLVDVAARKDARTSFLDVVCVVDESGSMSGEPLQLVKRLIWKTVDALEDRDRVSLVTFSDEAKRICPLTACGAVGKEKLRQCIDALQNFDSTRISEGLEIAKDVLSQRRARNAHTVVMLLTDGINNDRTESGKKCSSVIEEMREERATVHIFGLGDEHDSAFLRELAMKSGSLYQFISSQSDIDTAFSAVFPMLQVSLLRNLSLSVRPVQIEGLSVTVSRVFAESSRSAFQVPNLTAGQKEQILCVIQIRAEREISCSPVTVTVTYDDAEGGESQNKTEETLKFTREKERKPEKVEEVFLLWCQCEARECVQRARELAAKGQRREAMECLKQCAREIEEGRFAVTPEDAMRELTHAQFSLQREDQVHFPL